MVIVRLGQADEVDDAISVWETAHAVTGRDYPTHREHLRSWAAQSDAVLLVAEDSDRLVGMVLCLEGRADDGAGDRLPDLLHVTGLAVLPTYWRLGIGRALMGASIAEAVKAGRTRVTLWTLTDNESALRLFETYGFRQSGRQSKDELGATTQHLERII